MTQSFFDPSPVLKHYIESVCRDTGEVLDREVLPSQLLVHAYRDHHPVEVCVRFAMSQLMNISGDAKYTRKTMKALRLLGDRVSHGVARCLGQADVGRLAHTLFGLPSATSYYRYKAPALSPEDKAVRLEKLKRQAADQLAGVSPSGRLELRLFLTGATGFVGQEVLWQVAGDPDIVEVVALIRPKVIRHPQTREVMGVQSPQERGAAVLSSLGLTASDQLAKFRFVAGDVEQPQFGLEGSEFARLKSTITHVVHCAASVAFDDPFETSFRANVDGTVNALRFSHALQTTPGSPFVAHIGIETAYIHGRHTHRMATEDDLVFPRDYYNNYYELTKAFASIETDRFMVEHGLRVVQLCPSIVIGEARTGNNRGDTKVINAPINFFGQWRQKLDAAESGLKGLLTRAHAQLMFLFPSDPSAALNLIPVDWVAAGILASLKQPQAVGERIHLASDQCLTTDRILEMVSQELGVRVKMVDPTVCRILGIPLVAWILRGLNQGKVAHVMTKLSTMFAGYTEWGQPVHEVGKDHRILRLPAERPHAEMSFRMLCRHNRYVQAFGQLTDTNELARREQIWRACIRDLEQESGQPAGALEAREFQNAMETRLDDHWSQAALPTLQVVTPGRVATESWKHVA